MLIIIFFLVALTFFYYVFVTPLTYWKKQGVPQLNAIRILKDNFVGLFLKQGVAQTFESLCKSFPDSRYFGIYQFGKALVVKNADLIKKITVKDFDHFVNHVQFSSGDDPLWERNLFAMKGNKWKSLRATLSPSFTGSKMKLMFNLMLESTEKFVSYFEKDLQDKEYLTLEMKNIFSRFATDVIASMAFGYSCDSLREPNNTFYLNASKILPKEDLLHHIKQFVIFTMPNVAQFFGLKFFPKEATDFFSHIITQNVKDRKEKGIVRNDMIHLMMEEEKNRSQDVSKESITDVDITANALLFFFAGFETVSALMSFTTYELAVNVDVQTRLQEEVDDVLKKCKGRITYEALFKMKYLDMVISEALRKWPSGVVTDRVCTTPYEIQPEMPGEVLICLKEGDIVWIPTYSIHRDPKLFPNPERFDPERFDETNKSSMNPYAYTPFGSGPRSCIANRFALMEVKLLFFQVLAKFDIVVVEKTTIPIELDKLNFQLTSKGGFWLGLKLRN